MSDIVVGIKHLRDGIEPQTVLGAQMSVIGIVGTAEEANSDAFPLDEPTLIVSNDAEEVSALGDSGTIPDALKGISGQLGAGAAAALCVVVRVAEGGSVTETIANIVGSEGAKTGIWALLDAPEVLGVTPRLIIVPGYTSQAAGGVVSVDVTDPGSGYDSAPTVEFSGGGGTGATATAVIGDGEVVSINVTNPGSGYTSAPSVTLTGGDGDGAAATAVVDVLANGVCAAIPAVLGRLRAYFIPEGPSGARQDWLDWKETLPASARFLHPLRQDAKALDSDGDVVTKPLSPYIASLYVRRDAERDGVPSGSIANQNVYNLVGVTPAVRLDLTDPSSEGQDYLGMSAGIVARGEQGIEGAVGSSGFVFWGTDTLAEESEWLFAHVNRMRDYIELGQVQAEKVYLGKFNITMQTVQAIVNTIDSQLSRLAYDGHILPDYRVTFTPDANTPEELRVGHLDITFAAEEPPVLRKLTIRSRRHRAALESLVQQISIQLGAGQAI